MSKYFHLPDLPNVGYATQRERTGTDQIMLFIRAIERDRLRLLTTVCDGLDKWRRIAGSIFGTSSAIADDKLDEMFRYFELMAVKPETQRALLDTKHPDEWRAVMREAMGDIEAQRERVRLMAKFGCA